MQAPYLVVHVSRHNLGHPHYRGRGRPSLLFRQSCSLRVILRHSIIHPLASMTRDMPENDLVWRRYREVRRRHLHERFGVG